MTRPTLTTYGGRLRDIGYAGGLVDQNNVEIETRVNENAAAIDFGYAVARGASNDTCKPVLAAGVDIIGIAARHAIMPENSSDLTVFAQYAAVPIVKHGYIYAVPHDNVVANDPVVALVAQNGKLSSGDGSSYGVASSAAKSGGNTGTGTLTLDVTTPVLDGYKDGVYTVRCTVAAANSGTFEVQDPDGFVIGDVVVGATFADDIKFVIADGGTDFIVGDGFDITVSGGASARVRVPNAVWETTTAAGSVGVVRITK